VRCGIAHVPRARHPDRADGRRESAPRSHLRKNGSDVRKDYDRVFEYFPVLRERRHLSASTLSGGEQQMLAVARALLMRPRLMLLDEPSLGLAPMVVRAIFEIIRTINQADGVGVFLVEQNARLALELSSQAYVLEVGRVAVSGASSELMGKESVRRSYLGYEGSVPPRSSLHLRVLGGRAPTALKPASPPVRARSRIYAMRSLACSSSPWLRPPMPRNMRRTSGSRH